MNILRKFALMISKNNIKYVRSLGMKKVRKEGRVFVAEGVKLVADLIDFFNPRYIAATSKWMKANSEVVNRLLREGNVMVDEVTDSELERVSFLEAPQEVLVVFEQKDDHACIADVASDRLCLVLDEVQNPGNLGTIMRVADWFGIEHIYCSHSCADIYNPKTVQATMGAMARVKVHYCDLEEELEKLPAGIPVYGTFLDGENVYACDLEANGVVIMGNEGRGISAGVEKLVTKRLLIPNYPQERLTSESLNVAVATSVICAEFRRRCL